jgi:hypothetical protein
MSKKDPKNLMRHSVLIKIISLSASLEYKTQLSEIAKKIK